MSAPDIAAIVRKAACRVFGHRFPTRGWWGDGLYGQVTPRGVDGTGRSHFSVGLECPRCRKHWIVARFHGSQVQAHLKEQAS